MGEAKRRGTREERIQEGVAKRLLRNHDAMVARQARIAAMTPKQKAIVQMMLSLGEGK